MEYSIRPFRREDTADLARAANHAEVAVNLTDSFPNPYLFADAVQFVKEAVDPDNTSSIVRAICVDDCVVGCVALYRGEGSYKHTAELGYFIAPAYWGRGIAAHAVQEICDEFLDGDNISRIWARPMSENDASRKVLEKSGFSREGTARKGVRKDGKVHDTEVYSRVFEQ